jgi:hypothetical protein
MPSKLFDHFSAAAEMDARTVAASVPHDRRRRVRMQVHWPVFFLRPGIAEVLETVTHNLSSDGFYCLAKSPFTPSEVTECTLGIPTHYPRDPERMLSVHCRVRVIRVEALKENGMYGVGCRIEDYSFPPRSCRYSPKL